MTYLPDGSKTMQLYVVPREGQLAEGEALPLPTDSAVRLDAAGGELVAAMRFEGNATQEVCDAARQRLLTKLAEGAIHAGCWGR